MPTIQLTNVKKRFKKTNAIEDLTLSVAPEQITAFLGPNGAGKTTTIKLLLGLHRQDSGTIQVLGKDSRKMGSELFKQIAYVSENQKLPTWMTVGQLLDFCRPLYPTWDRKLEDSLLKQFELPLKTKLKHLSRGQQMKASLLSSLAYRPKLVVLDEPFSGLDPLARDELISGLLKFTAEEKWTIFISSHDIEEVQRLADNIAIIDHGKLKLNESTESLLLRFRQVDVLLEHEQTLPNPLPETWLNVQHAGRILRFTHSQWSDENGLSDIAAQLKDVKQDDVTTHTLSLREIFIQLAKDFQLSLNAPST